MLCRVREDEAIEQMSAQLRESPFYNFLKENRDFVLGIDPMLTELEVVAFLQAKWESMSVFEQEAYSLREPRSNVDERMSQESEPSEIDPPTETAPVTAPTKKSPQDKEDKSTSIKDIRRTNKRVQAR